MTYFKLKFFNQEPRLEPGTSDLPINIRELHQMSNLDFWHKLEKKRHVKCNFKYRWKEMQ